MFKNYIKAAFRNLLKNKGYSFLNIGGLAIGMACAGLIFLWVEDELTFNHYFSNRDNLYKTKDRQTYDGNTFTFDATPGPLAEAMKTEIPGLKNTARTTWGNQVLFTAKDKPIYEQGLFVDSSFLTMFQLQFVQGNAKTAFTQLHTLVISETMAKKFFGTTQVIGKTLKVDNKQDYEVSGVFMDLPKNVSFSFNWLAPFRIYLDQNKWLTSWGNNGIVTYVETEPNADITAINKKLYGIVQTKEKEASAHMSIYSMNRWRMYDNFENGNEIPGRIQYVHLFNIIAWIILVIACINFMNLSTARSEQRAKEVGVRKVMGAGKRKLIAQFIGESVFTSLVALLLSIAIIYVSLPSFNTIVEKHLSVNIFNPLHIAVLLGIALICGFVAGSYPAFYLSSFNPIYVLKGIKIKSAGSAGFVRKSLVVVQFSVSVILIISTIVIYLQINHVKDRNLGYNKNNLMIMYMQGKIKENYTVIKNDLLSTGLVQNTSMSNNQILQLGSNTGDFSWEGKDPSRQILITVEQVSQEYPATMGLRIKDGRVFYLNFKSDSNSVIINESLAALMNKKNIVGSIISGQGHQFTVVGVIKDFIFNDMYAPAAPLMLFADTSNVNVMSVRLKEGVSVPAALAKMETIFKNNNPGYPFDYSFIDQQFAQLFKTETLIGQLAEVFAVLAISISCLGLFGLAAYTAEKRSKEIGIRKILGASVQGITGLISKDFLMLVGISCVISFPIAWWLMHDWLENYKYRIQISWWIFVGAGLLAVLIALLTVSFQAIKAAVANPVTSLRSE
jgi:ABC-type antimicrobial peptide transport system permease subunit